MAASRLPQRYAVYFAPAPGSPLERFGSAVLGYDLHRGHAIAQPALPGLTPEALDAATAEPRRYGFHATLKAPFRLAEGCSPAELAGAVRALASSRSAVEVGRLEPALLGAFVALVPAAPSRTLDLLAAECVAALDPLRAPMEAAERGRRHGAGLTPRQAALLDRWGYPHVFEEFRFHLTLAGPLAPAERNTWLTRLADAFAPISEELVSIDALTLLQQEPGSPFRSLDRFSLGARDAR